MMQVGRRIGREIGPQPVDARLRRRGSRVVFGCISCCEGRDERTVIVIMFQRRPAALEPIKAPVRFLKCPDSIERFPGQRMQLSGCEGIVQSQGPGGRDRPRYPIWVWTPCFRHPSERRDPQKNAEPRSNRPIPVPSKSDAQRGRDNWCGNCRIDAVRSSPEPSHRENERRAARTRPGPAAHGKSRDRRIRSGHGFDSWAEDRPGWPIAMTKTAPQKATWTLPVLPEKCRITAANLQLDYPFSNINPPISHFPTTRDGSAQSQAISNPLGKPEGRSISCARSSVVNGFRPMRRCGKSVQRSAARLKQVVPCIVPRIRSATE